VDEAGLEFKATIGAGFGIGADARFTLGAGIFKFNVTLGANSIILSDSSLALRTKELCTMGALLIQGLQGDAAVRASG
jgi:hypothetical protein